jgi:hypothetical protein
MKTMPTAFLLTGLSPSALVEQATAWGWEAITSIGEDIIFETATGDVIRSTRSASQVSHLKVGARILLGPSHQECDGLEDLALKIRLGEFRAYSYPPKAVVLA